MDGSLARAFALLLCLGPVAGFLPARAAQTFRVATYNLENYADGRVGNRPPKSPAGRAKIRESIRTIRPDVLALQEVAGVSALNELRLSLAREGLSYPHWEFATGFDTNIQVAILSRFPFTARRSHTNLGFLLQGRRFQVGRGFAEVDVQVTPSYSFTIITAHLKSRRPVPAGDEADLREREALKLREIIDRRLASTPDLNLVVLGDFNDVTDSTSTRRLVGQGRTALIDTRPAERNGDDAPNPVNPRFEPRNITWTHYYGKEDSYSRVDYILISRGMAREWVREETWVPGIPNWGVGSDHRPIVATFMARDQ